ncbi:homoserine kinase, partial [Sulfolobus sp. E5]
MECRRAIAYSSSANLGAGFDILSMAHTAFHDIVEVQIEDSTNREIEIISVNNPSIPTEIDKNSAMYPMKKLLEDKGINVKVRVKIIKGVP